MDVKHHSTNKNCPGNEKEELWVVRRLGVCGPSLRQLPVDGNEDGGGGWVGGCKS